MINIKTKRIVKKPLESTQSNIPIKEIINGIVVTKDNRYIKIMEVKPITYNLKAKSEQNKIFESFCAVLKLAPTLIQFTSVALMADLDKQIKLLERDMECEKDLNCLKIEKVYRERLIASKYSKTTRRFFFSFEYDGVKKSDYKEDEIIKIIDRLEKISSLLKGALKSCGNDVVEVGESDSNYLTLDILYAILNRHKSIEVPLDKRRDEIFLKYFKEMGNTNFYVSPNEIIAPDMINFTNRKYVVVNGNNKNHATYYSFLYIPSRGYRNKVEMGWLEMFINSYKGVDVNIFAEKVPSEKVIGDIKRHMTYNEASYQNVGELSSAHDSAISSFYSGNYIKNGLEARQEFFYMAILITVCDSDPALVDIKIENLKNIAKANDIRLKECEYKEELAFFSSLPLCNLNNRIWQKAKRNVITEGVASTYPFTTFEINDEDGIYFGDDLNTGSPVVVDIFKFDNHNIFICGRTGSGKSYALKLMAIRMRIKHIPTYIIAPEKQFEFRRLCEAIGGEFVELGPSTNNRINVMEIFKQVETINDEDKEKSLLMKKISMLKQFFNLHLKLKDNQTVELTILDNALVDTYKKYGISEDNSSLIDPDDFMCERFKKMPIISDLQETLRENPKRQAQDMALALDYFTKGSGKIFNGYTNVSLSNDFTVIGLENAGEGKEMYLNYYLAMDFVKSKIMQDISRKKVFITDEWWKFASNEIGANASLQIAKIIRAYNASMIIATQQMSDVLAYDNGQLGKNVLNNCQTKILLGMEEDDINTVSSLVGLTDVEEHSLFYASQGEALFLAGKDKLRLSFKASEIEHKLITTKSEEMVKYEKERKENIMANKVIDLDNKDDDVIELISID